MKTIILFLLSLFVEKAYSAQANIDVQTQTDFSEYALNKSIKDDSFKTPAAALVDKLIKKLEDLRKTRPSKPVDSFNAFKEFLLDQKNIQKLTAFLLAWNGMTEKEKEEFAVDFSAYAGEDRKKALSKLTQLQEKKDLQFNNEKEKFNFVYSSDYADIKLVSNKNDFTLLFLYTIRDMKKNFDYLKSKKKITPLLDDKNNKINFASVDGPLKYQMTIYIKKDGSYYGRVLNFNLDMINNNIPPKDFYDALENLERDALQQKEEPVMDSGFSLDD